MKKLIRCLSDSPMFYSPIGYCVHLPKFFLPAAYFFNSSEFSNANVCHYMVMKHYRKASSLHILCLMIITDVLTLIYSCTGDLGDLHFLTEGIGGINMGGMPPMGGGAPFGKDTGIADLFG